jgi:hypothetical protein
MAKSPLPVDVDAGNLATLPCCGMKNPAHPGRRLKNCWMKRYLRKGLRAKVLMTPDNRQCGYCHDREIRSFTVGRTQSCAARVGSCEKIRGTRLRPRLTD